MAAPALEPCPAGHRPMGRSGTEKADLRGKEVFLNQSRVEVARKEKVLQKKQVLMGREEIQH